MLKPTSVLSSTLSALSLVLMAGCGSSSSPAGGAVTGPLDSHCDGVAPQVVGLCSCDIPTRSADGTVVNVTKTESLVMCIADSAAAGAGDQAAAPQRLVTSRQSADSTAAGGASGSDDGSTSDFGATLYGSTGDDDDCKYSVAWTSTPIRENTNVTFTVTVKELASTPALAPETGGDVVLESFLTDSHPADTSLTTSIESPAGSGIYKVGPIRFDAAGTWTVRFHFNELCSDDEDDSPHGHAAFFIDVP